MKEISLTQGKVTLVDDEDFEWLKGFSWCAHRHKTKTRDIWYAETMVRSVYGGRFLATMHSMILIAEKGFVVDHIDNDGLHNFKSNLRQADGFHNRGNSIKQRTINGVVCSSRYKGVHWSKRKKRWKAQIQTASNPKRLGSFHSEEDAARAYDNEAIKQFGEFARLNFPIQPLTIN